MREVVEFDLRSNIVKASVDLIISKNEDECICVYDIDFDESMSKSVVYLLGENGYRSELDNWNNVIVYPKFKPINKRG